MPDSAPTSPTGTPLLSQRVVRVLFVLYAMLGALDAAFAAQYGISAKPTLYLFFALVFIGPAIGQASPGLRKPPEVS